jgi:hypothetical protein
MVIVQSENLRRVAEGNRTPEQTKVAAAKTAPVGLKQPPEGSLDTVPRGYISEIDGLAIRAAVREEPEGWAHHKAGPSAFAELDGIV